MSTPVTPPPHYRQQAPGQQQVPVSPEIPGPRQPYPYAAMPGVPAYARPEPPGGPLGRMRPTGMTILLFLVTFGIWGFVYYYQVHEELKRHSGSGLGGVWGLVIALLFGLVSPFLLSNEVGQLYQRRGQQPPVSAATGLWFFPGILILAGPFIWFVRTNDALNAYWYDLGVRETTLV